MESNVTVAELQQVGGNTNSEQHPTRPWLKAPWKKGQSGNPSGRPRKITNAVEKLLNKRDAETGEKNTEVFAKAMLKRAISRSDVMAKEIWDRVEGPLEAESGSSAPVAIQIVIETVGGEK